MDESNIHGGARFITVGAAWASADVWADWTKEWCEAIAPLPYYHSVDVHNRNGLWSGWSRKERDEFAIRALAVIKNHKIEGRIAYLDRDVLRRGFGSDDAVNKSIMEHPYYPCFIWSAQRCAQIMKDRGFEDVNFFHENNEFLEGALDHFKILKCKQIIPDFLLSFGNKIKYPPLQCADVLAYEGQHQLASLNQVRKPLEAIDENSGRIQFQKVTDDQMLDLVEAIKAGGSPCCR